MRIRRLFGRKLLGDAPDVGKRNFMKAAAVAPVALPAMGSPSHLMSLAMVEGMAGDSSMAENCTSSPRCTPVSAKADIAYYRNMLETIGEDRGDDVRSLLQGARLGGVGYDLAIMRSFSFSAKVRIHANRTIDRQVEERRSRYIRRIEELLKGD